MSELGLRHAPAPWTHGGIVVREEIRRDATLNLVALRALRARPALEARGDRGEKRPHPDAGPVEPPSTAEARDASVGDPSLSLRRYILGLSLVAFTAPQESFLREGCQLVPDQARPAAWGLVRHDGSQESHFRVSHEEALAYAETTAAAFGVGPGRRATFNPDSAREALRQSKEERKKARREKGSKAEADSET